MPRAVIHSPAGPRFVTVSPEDAQSLLVNENGRRDWTDVKAALQRGSRLFLTEDQLPTSGVKYLSLMFARKQLKRTLHSRKVVHEGKKGRLIWLDPDTKATNGEAVA